jgi:ketosteroid isomerase-like protein
VAESKVERLREAYAAYNRGERLEALDLLTDDFELRDRPELPDPRTSRGAREARAAMLSAGDDFEDWVVVPYDFVEVGDCVVVCARQRGTGRMSGATVEGDIFHVWRLRGERASGMRAFSTREDAMEAARSW